MRLMSFSLTWPQIIAHEKTVTRRLGWSFLKPGQRFQAVQKGMGLKKGQKVVRGPVLECISNQSEELQDITLCPFRNAFQFNEVVREGFRGMSSEEFIRMFFNHNHCRPDTIINRIEFRYVL